MSEQTRVVADRYELTRQVGVCGEAVSYLGFDRQEQKKVTVREFFLPDMMRREADGTLTVLPGHEVLYKSLSSDFEELCSYTMALQKRGLLCPVDVVRADNTVYAIEPFVGYQTLGDYLAQAGSMSWLQLKKAVAPMMSAVNRLHSDGTYHRGISPETVLVSDRGEFLLTGLCIPAARTSESEVPCTLYFGYSAPEQYYSTSWQGSWTDVYSLAAVCYRALTGTTPVEFRQRGEGRALAVPSALVPGIPENVSNALITALSVDIRNRYRTVEELWSNLLHGPGDTTAVHPQQPVVRREAKPRSRWRPFALAGGILLIVAAVAMLSIGFLRLLIGPLEPTPPPPEPPPLSSSEEPSFSAPSEPEPEPEPVRAPDLVGLSVEKVMIDPLFKQMFTFEPQFVYSEKLPIGSIVGHEPSAGEEIGDDNTILLFVSKGSELTFMPDVLDLSLEDAMQVLIEQDIRYEVQEVFDVEHPDRTVISASADIGSILYRTTDVVTLRVARQYIVSEVPSSSDASGTP